MHKLVLKKSPPLFGSVRVSSSKNALLPLMAASLLTSDESTILELPLVDDILVMVEILRAIGCCVKITDRALLVKPNIACNSIPRELTGRLRGSSLTLGPLLARSGEIELALPGGCSIGKRPLDLHIWGLTQMGADFSIENTTIAARAPKRLSGCKLYLPFPSVGATENLMMAATLAEGKTVIDNAAAEPEIEDLSCFLNKMGARVSGAGTKTITIEGVSRLYGTKHQPIPDRIEAGTLLIAAAVTGGNVTVENAIPLHLKPVIQKLREAGATVIEYERSVRIVSDGKLRAIDVTASPHPGYPTDLQAQLVALAAVAEGKSHITDSVFEDRFRQTQELLRMGAHITLASRSATVEGGGLRGAAVQAMDLRGGAAVIIAGLAAEGETVIGGLHHIDRGYEGLEAKLAHLGAPITRMLF